MKLPHGNTRTAILARINGRAMALCNQEFLQEKDLQDSCDINSHEDEEIAFAKALAAEWVKGKSIEAWHLHGVNEHIAKVDGEVRATLGNYIHDYILP